MPPVVIDLCESPSPAKRLPLRRRSSRLNPNNDNNKGDNDDEPLPLVPTKSKSKASRPKIRFPNRPLPRSFRQALAKHSKENRTDDPFDDTPPPARSTRSSSRGAPNETSFGRRLRKFQAANANTKTQAAAKPKPRKTKTKDNRSRSFNEIMEDVFSSGKKRGKESVARKRKTNTHDDSDYLKMLEDAFQSGKESASRKRKKKTHDDSDFDSDIQVVEKPVERPIARPKKAAKSAKESDDELSVVGTTGTNVLVDYPHSREDCVVEKFTPGNYSNYCDKCYCFVCDVPAKDCKSWETGSKGQEGHCHATHKDPKWIGIQKETRTGATFRR